MYGPEITEKVSIFENTTGPTICIFVVANSITETILMMSAIMQFLILTNENDLLLVICKMCTPWMVLKWHLLISN